MLADVALITIFHRDLKTMTKHDEDYNNNETYQKVSKMSLLLGIAYAGIKEIINSPDNTKHYKCVALMHKLEKGIDIIYYDRPEND